VKTLANAQLTTNATVDNIAEEPTEGDSGAAYYTALGVTTDADVDTIRKAYRRLAIRHHPDKGGDSEQFRSITTAFECLSDVSQRALYDRLWQGATGQSKNNEADGDAPTPTAAPAPERSARHRAPPDRMDPAEERARPQLMVKKQNTTRGTNKAEVARTAATARKETAPTNEVAAARALTRARSRQAADDTSRGATGASSTPADTASHNEAPGIAQQLPARVDSWGAPVLEFLLRGTNLVYDAPDLTAATRGRMPKGPHRVLETRDSTTGETWLHVTEGGWVRVRIDTAAPAVRRAPARRTAASPSTPTAKGTKSSRKAAKTPPQAPPKKKITQRMTSAGEHGGEGDEGQ
jgi:curved DNA-binding protein CbpA